MTGASRWLGQCHADRCCDKCEHVVFWYGTGRGCSARRCGAAGRCDSVVGRTLFLGKAAQRQDGTAGQPTPPEADFIRSWIAISLVIGLISFCAIAFAVNDTTLRSTLIGGLIASVGSAIAFYFSSKSADKARQDIANAATLGTEMVPSLIGKTKEVAAQVLGKTSFSLKEDPASPAGGDIIVEMHNPSANTNAPRGSSVWVTLVSPPSPP